MLDCAGMLTKIWTWYPDFMFKRRLACLSGRGIHFNTVVIDGNAKLARRICGRACGEMFHCTELNRQSSLDLPSRPHEPEEQQVFR